MLSKSLAHTINHVCFIYSRSQDFGTRMYLPIYIYIHRVYIHIYTCFLHIEYLCVCVHIMTWTHGIVWNIHTDPTHFSTSSQWHLLLQLDGSVPRLPGEEFPIDPWGCRPVWRLFSSGFTKSISSILLPKIIRDVTCVLSCFTCIDLCLPLIRPA